MERNRKTRPHRRNKKRNKESEGPCEEEQGSAGSALEPSEKQTPSERSALKLGVDATVNVVDYQGRTLTTSSLDQEEEGTSVLTGPSFVDPVTSESTTTPQKTSESGSDE